MALWNAVDILKSAEDEIDTSRMISALNEIAKFTKRKELSEMLIVHRMAQNGLGVDPDKKEGEVK